MKGLVIMLPHYHELYLPLLAELQRRGGISRPRDCNDAKQTIYIALAKYFDLTEADLQEKVYEDDGTSRSKWENVVRWARNDLKKKHLLLAPTHGVWAIGEEGLRLLNSKRSSLRSPYNT